MLIRYLTSIENTPFVALNRTPFRQRYKTRDARRIELKPDRIRSEIGNIRDRRYGIDDGNVNEVNRTLKTAGWTVRITSVIALMGFVYYWCQATQPTPNRASNPPSGSIAQTVQTATQETFTHWFDDVQEMETSIFERPDHTVLPDTAACRWIADYRQEAAVAVSLDLKTKVNLGNAVLAGYLDLKDAIPDLIEGWTKLLDDQPYNGESSIDGKADLPYFRELQGIAYVIERLSGKPLRQAVRLTDTQSQRLISRAAEDNEAARAILSALK